MPKIFKVTLFDPTSFPPKAPKSLRKNAALHGVIEVLSQGFKPCLSVIAESDYVDRDYQDEYAAYYCKTFRQYPSRCMRYHFFSTILPEGSLKNISAFQADYLGFMVLRPTENQSVGRTILRQDSTITGKQYIHCLATFSVHILGETLTVTGAPFIQQDKQVGACAQASLWMAAKYLSARYGYRDFTTPQITALAKRNMSGGRRYPADRGLECAQMLDALEGMGYPAEVYSRYQVFDCGPHIRKIFSSNNKKTKQGKRKKRVSRTKIDTIKLADIAYRYIESGLPVILMTKNHAFVGIGHTFDPSKGSVAAIQRIPSFITNNDAEGPYIQINIWDKSKAIESFDNITEIITITPNEVSLRGEEAESLAWEMFPVFRKKYLKMAQEVDDYRKDLVRWISRQHIILRTYLIKSFEFQSDLRRQWNSGELDPVVCEKLLELDYPKYIWVTEVTTRKVLDDPTAKDRTCLGCFIADSTAPSKSPALLAAHVLDTLAIFEQSSSNGDQSERDGTSTKQFLDVKDSTPFIPRHMARAG